MIEYHGIYAKIDLHGLSEVEATIYLNQIIGSLPKNIVELTVAHGYRSGAVLQNMVRKKYHHKRVARKMISGNPGETILVIK